MSGRRIAEKPVVADGDTGRRLAECTLDVGLCYLMADVEAESAGEVKGVGLSLASEARTQPSALKFSTSRPILALPDWLELAVSPSVSLYKEVSAMYNLMYIFAPDFDLPMLQARSERGCLDR